MSLECPAESTGAFAIAIEKGINPMRFTTNLALTFLGAALVCVSGQAIAKPVKRQAVAKTIETHVSPSEIDFGRRVIQSPVAAATAAPTATGKTARVSRRAQKQAAAQAAQASANTSILPSLGGGDVVSEARRYLGGNPTGRNSLWCGAFMDMVLKKTGHKGGGNLARAYASYGRRVSGPEVGAIAVMSRGRGGGHVGVVSGIDASGNPIVISGNHNDIVAESTYPRGRIIAYVMPE
jgi:uncharacterized protein (TIGR02594 family)